LEVPKSIGDCSGAGQLPPGFSFLDFGWSGEKAFALNTFP